VLRVGKIYRNMLELVGFTEDMLEQVRFKGTGKIG